MNSDFKKLIQEAKNYEFDPKLLDAIPITGILRKSHDPKNFIVVISHKSGGDMIVEVESDDVVKHEVEKKSEHAKDQEDRVKLYLKPTAIVTTSFKGKITNSLIVSAFREKVSPFSKIDRLLNLLDRLSWNECLARGKAECENLYPPGPARDQCITDKYIECGPPPRLEVSERVLEQLLELLRGPNP